MPAGRVHRALFIAGLLSLGVAGCATGDYAIVTTIAGGQEIHVPLGRGGPVMTNEDGVQINAANLTLNPEKKLIYAFAFTDSRQRSLRHVRVEDVSDTAGVTFVDDAQPKLSPAGKWQGDSETLDVTESRLSWIETLPNTLRVYRFTLTFADGRTLVLHQGTMFPAPMKASVRHTFGQNY